MTNDNCKKKGKYIFVSYAHADVDKVKKDIDVMRQNGINVWFDENLLAGEGWEARVQAAIDDESCVGAVFFLTKTSIESVAVNKEIDMVSAHIEKHPDFKYLSINEEGKKPFQLITDNSTLSSARIGTLMRFFDDSIIYLKRFGAITDYYYDFQRSMQEWNAVGQGFVEWDLYETKPVTISGNQGAQIVRYNGSEPHVIIPIFINGMRVLSIGECAFQNARIESVIIPNGVLRIGAHCFDNCQELSTVELPETVCEIGYEAFRNNKKLVFVTLPSQLTVLGGYCFYRCHQLGSVYFKSEKPIVLGFACFSECIKLEQVVLPEEIEEVGSYAFNKCSSLKSVTFYNVKNVGKEIFHNCAVLENVSFNSIPLSIGEDLFSHCRKMRTISVDQDIYQAFLGATEWAPYRAMLVELLHSPEHVYYENGYVVWDANDRTTKFGVSVREYNEAGKSRYHVVNENKFALDLAQGGSYGVRVAALQIRGDQRSSGLSQPFVFGEACMEYHLSEDGKTLLEYKGTAATPKLPDSVEEIGEGAFKFCSIESVDFGNAKVLRIGREAFAYCSGLQTIALPDTLERIDGYAFCGCTALKTVVFDENLTEMGPYTFAYCTSLREIDLRPTRLAEISERCFYRCEKLEDLYVGDNVTSFGKACLRGAVGFLRLHLGKVKQLRIDEIAFSFNISLLEYHIPEGVTEIGPGALYYSNSLQKITSDNPLFPVENGVLLSKRDDRVVLHYPADLPARENAIAADAIESLAINDLDTLLSVRLVGVKEIRSDNFTFCQLLEKVYVDSDEVEICDNCFSNNPCLTEVHLNGNLAKMGEGCFKKNATQFKIYVQGLFYDELYNREDLADIRHLLAVEGDIG